MISQGECKFKIDGILTYPLAKMGEESMLPSTIAKHDRKVKSKKNCSASQKMNSKPKKAEKWQPLHRTRVDGTERQIAYSYGKVYASFPKSPCKGGGPQVDGAHPSMSPLILLNVPVVLLPLLDAVSRRQVWLDVSNSLSRTLPFSCVECASISRNS